MSFTYKPATNPYPVVADWDGDGTDTVGVKAGATWVLNNANDASGPEVSFDFRSSERPTGGVDVMKSCPPGEPAAAATASTNAGSSRAAGS